MSDVSNPEMIASRPAPFGRVLSAMVTPFTAEGALDVTGAATLAAALVDRGHDGLVINGTTGEAPTTTDAEKNLLLRSVIEAVGDRATVVAGVGSNNTAHTIELAQAAQAAGADGLLVVTPYYNKPPVAGLIAHFQAVAEATDLPVMLYDIPGRTSLAITTETLVQLAEHRKIVAVKDAKGDLAESAEVMRRTDLAYYSGEDKLTLPLLSVGACGVVGVPTHLFAREVNAMIEAYLAGDVAGALAWHRQLLPVFTGFFRTQGAILTKAALGMVGLPGGPMRLPLVDATPVQLTQLAADLAEAGWTLNGWRSGALAGSS